MVDEPGNEYAKVDKMFPTLKDAVGLKGEPACTFFINDPRIYKIGKNMLRIMLVALFFLAGCTSHKPTILPGYTGGMATINDTFERLSRSKANMYYVKQLNGNTLPNALTATNAATYNQGSLLIAQGASRNVPSESLKLTLAGRVHHSAPIGYAFGGKTNYRVEGDILFTPKADSTYLVKGDLRQDYAAVWLEDVNGNIVSDIVVTGDANKQKNNSLKNIRKNIKKSSRSELFLKISSGEISDFVQQKIGVPDDVTEYKGNLFIQKPPHTTFHYRDLGDIRFSSGADDKLFVEKLIPKISENSDDIESAREQLTAREGTTLQDIAKSYYQKEKISQEILDLFAEKVWVERQTENPYTVDALSWFCKTLAKSNNPRYRDLLKNVAQGGKNKKLRKYAKISWQQLPAEPAAQYQPLTE